MLKSLLSFFREEKQNNTFTLENGLIYSINMVSEKFESINQPYMIDIIKDGVVEFQIFHGIVLNETQTPQNEFNYSFNLPLNEEEMQERFEQLEIKDKFMFHTFDGITCFTLNNGNDKRQAKEIAITLLTEVFQFSISDVFQFDISEC